MSEVRWVAALFLGALIILSTTGNQNQICPSAYLTDLKTGPYVDSVEFKIYQSSDLSFHDLESGTLEMNMFNGWDNQLQELEANPNIAVSSIKRNGYGHLTINCAKYPLNISGLRRAFAFAFDKASVLTSPNTLLDFMFIHDSLVAPANPFCIETHLPFHYYDTRPDIGNEILDELGFSIDNTTGYRKTPNGTNFQITVEDLSVLLNPIPQLAVQAFNSLHINARRVNVEVSDAFLRLDNHEDYDVMFYGSVFQNDDVRWLANEYWSFNANAPGQNPCNFQNDTFDSWRHQLLYGTTYEEVYEAAAEMQKILHYNVPRLVVYGNYYKQAYRIDKYCGHIEDAIMGISGEWTLRKLHLIDTPMEGGTISVGINEHFTPVNLPSSFNLFEHAGADSSIITRCLYSSLYKRGPDLQPVSDLAQKMLVETHSDNSMISDGSTRFTIDIVQNATWSDGVPLTAEDAAFTFNLLLEVSDDIGFDSPYLTGVYSPSPFRVVIEYSNESYWLFSDFAYVPIVPKHVFVGFSLEDLINWNPIYNPSHPLVTSGPFILSEYVPEECFRLRRNSLFYYGISEDNLTTTQGTTGAAIASGDIIVLGLLVALPAIAVVVFIRSRIDIRAD